MFKKKACFVNKTTQTSIATSNTSNSNINVEIPQYSESNSSEEEDIKCSRKSHVKGSSSEEEEIGIHKCRRIIRVVIMNKESKGCTLS